MSIFIIIISTIITGVVMWFLLPWLLIGLGIGLASGIVLIIAIIRILGSKAPTSLAISEVFYKLTGYKATIYNIPTQQPQVVKATVYGNGHDYADLLDVLKKQGFPSSTAKEAAKFAINEAYGQPLLEKIRVALQYIGGGDKTTTTKD